jgi:hypothetical protein
MLKTTFKVLRKLSIYYSSLVLLGRFGKTCKGVLVHAMIAERGLEAQIHLFSSSELEAYECSALHLSWFTSLDWVPGAHWNAGWGGAKVGLSAFEKWFLVLVGQPVSHTLYSLSHHDMIEMLQYCGCSFIMHKQYRKTAHIVIHRSVHE